MAELRTTAVLGYAEVKETSAVRVSALLAYAEAKETSAVRVSALLAYAEVFVPPAVPPAVTNTAWGYYQGS